MDGLRRDGGYRIRGAVSDQGAAHRQHQPSRLGLLCGAGLQQLAARSLSKAEPAIERHGAASIAGRRGSSRRVAPGSQRFGLRRRHVAVARIATRSRAQNLLARLCRSGAPGLRVGSARRRAPWHGPGYL